MNISHSLQNNMQDSVTSAASITDVSRMVGLSRARFYQLVKAGVFPPPVYDVRTKRPFYTCDQQKISLAVRKMNLGINGQPILFYARKAPFGKKPQPSTRQNKKNEQSSRWNSIVDGLKSLGLEVTSAEVEAIIRTDYPSGTDGLDEGELLRTCFRNLRQQKMRRNCSDNVGR